MGVTYRYYPLLSFIQIFAKMYTFTPITAHKVRFVHDGLAKCTLSNLIKNLIAALFP